MVGGREATGVTGAVLASAAAHLVVAAGTGAAAVATGSTAAVAVGAGAAAVVLGHLLVLRAERRVRRRADHPHPFGHGREHFFWPMALTVLLLGVAAAVAVVVGLEQVDRPEALDEPTLATGVLGGALLVAALGTWLAARPADRARGRASWWRFVRHADGPTLPVVLVAGVGTVLVALAGGAAVATAQATDDPTADGIGALVVAGVLTLVAVVLVAEVRALLLGTTATRKEVESIRAAVEVDPAVRSLLHMRVQHQGPEELLVGMRVELDHTLTFPEVSEVVSRLERNVRRAVPSARALYVEPDLDVARRAAPAVGEHAPTHEVPPEIRAKLKLEEQRGALGVGIPVEPDDL